MECEVRINGSVKTTGKKERYYVQLTRSAIFKGSTSELPETPFVVMTSIDEFRPLETNKYIVFIKGPEIFKVVPSTYKTVRVIKNLSTNVKAAGDRLHGSEIGIESAAMTADVIMSAKVLACGMVTSTGKIKMLSDIRMQISSVHKGRIDQPISKYKCLVTTEELPQIGKTYIFVINAHTNEIMKLLEPTNENRRALQRAFP